MRKCSSRKLIGPILVAVLSLTILLSSTTGPVMGEGVGDFDYVLIKDDTEVQITGYSGTRSDVVIPSTIEELSVTSIRYSAFAGTTWLTSVTIPEGVDSIGNFAFQDCSSLASIEMPDSITTIGSYAFSGCSGLTSVIIPANVVSIGAALFSDCTSLSLVSLPEGLVSIGNAAFQGCTSLTSIVIPDGVSKIDSFAFRDCDNLASVKMPDSITTLGNSIFYGCTNLTSVTIPAGATSISYQMFEGCTSLGSVTIPSNITKIESWAFADCSSLTEIWFEGDAPTVSASWVLNHDPDLAIYHLRSANGYDAEAWAGLNLISLNVPSVPQDVRAVGHKESALVSWDVPLTDGNSTITGYEVLYNEGDGWDRYGDILSADDRSITLTGLEAGRSYEFAVKVINAIGASAMSDVASAVPFTTPAAPQVSAVADDGSVTLTWNELVAPENGWADIDRYVIYVDGVEVAQASELSFIITGLNNGQSYSFAVAAHNAGGLGPRSPSITASPFTSPDAPNELNVDVGPGQATLSWSAPTFDGGRPIDHYVVYQDGMEIAQTTDAVLVITGLINGQEYSFVVVAHNAAGNGAQSNSVLAAPFTVPEAPTGLDAVPGDGQVMLNWTAPAFDGGSPISGYEIWFGTSDNASKWTKHGENLAADRTNVTVSGLEAGTKYYFGIKAVNAAGPSAMSSALSTETWPALVPISGRVVDAEGNGLAGVTVSLGNTTSATTDADGNFVIMASRGDHILTVSGEGIESHTSNVTVDGLELDLDIIEVSKAAAADPSDGTSMIIMAIAIAAVLTGVLVYLRQRRR